MSKHVGQEREAYCPYCDATTRQFVYHSGEWVCTDCGNEVATHE